MLTVEDLVPTAAVAASDTPDQAEAWDQVPPLVAAAPTPARQALRPAVWLLAVGYLVAAQIGRALVAVLDAWVRAADAAGRAVRRAGLAVLRWLGPLGRLVCRLCAPVVRLLRWCWDRANLWLLLRMFRPLGRWARALVRRCRPAYERLLAAVQRVLARAEPLLRAVTALLDAVEAAASRLSARWHRVWAPVVRVARELRRRG